MVLQDPGTRAVAELARVHDDRDLPDHPLAPQPLDPVHDLLAVDPEPLAQHVPRGAVEREVPLDLVEELPVDPVHLGHVDVEARGLLLRLPRDGQPPPPRL